MGSEAKLIEINPKKETKILFNIVILYKKIIAKD